MLAAVAPTHPIGSHGLARAYAGMIRSRGPWRLFVTLTTRDPAGGEQLARKYRRLVRDVDESSWGLGLAGSPLFSPWRLRWVCAWEPQRRRAWHLHALWSAPGLASVPRRPLKRRWNALAGRSRALVDELDRGVTWLVSSTEPLRGVRRPGLAGIGRFDIVRGDHEVAAYCSKYVCKGGLVDLAGIRVTGPPTRAIGSAWA